MKYICTGREGQWQVIRVANSQLGAGIYQFGALSPALGISESVWVALGTMKTSS